MATTTLNINGRKYDLPLAGHETLLEVLRDRLGLTGTKTACQEAECGACTVMLNGQSVLACILLAVDVAGQEIVTIEGLARGDDLHPVQQAFLEKGAVQCGFCMPGMIMSSTALLRKHPDPSPEEIRQGIDGNICRCAGYLKIIEAIDYAGQLLRAEARPNPEEPHEQPRAE